MKVKKEIRRETLEWREERQKQKRKRISKNFKSLRQDLRFNIAIPKNYLHFIFTPLTRKLVLKS
jgi:hypothetical protein